MAPNWQCSEDPGEKGRESKTRGSRRAGRPWEIPTDRKDREGLQGGLVVRHDGIQTGGPMLPYFLPFSLFSHCAPHRWTPCVEIFQFGVRFSPLDHHRLRVPPRSSTGYGPRCLLIPSTSTFRAPTRPPLFRTQEFLGVPRTFFTLTKLRIQNHAHSFYQLHNLAPLVWRLFNSFVTTVAAFCANFYCFRTVLLQGVSLLVFPELAALSKQFLAGLLAFP